MRLDDLETALRTVNRLFLENTNASDYATLFFAEYDGPLRRLRYVNCGHLAGLLLHARHSIEYLSSTSTVLGLFGDWDCAVETCELQQGDILALYTDGVTECFNDAGHEFGEAGLLVSLTRYAELSPRDMVEAVLADVQRFGANEQHDDITLMIAKSRS